MTIDPVSLAITAALTATSMALTAMQKIEGPRLDDLSVTLADYGTPLVNFRGTRRFEGCPIIWAEDIREVKKKRKTKGGKYNEYTYFGTWAVAVAGHEIDAVKRIWFDKHLVYDAGAAGPITPAASGISVEQNIRIYLGTDDQEPDPRMLASVDAEHGAGSTPAYRGTAYIVFEEIPLEKVGNRLPQIMVEAVYNKSDAYPRTTVPGAPPGIGQMINFTFSPDFSKFVALSGSSFQVWDNATHSLMFSGELGGNAWTAAGIGLDSDGNIYTIGQALFWTNLIYVYAPDGGEPTILRETESEIADQQTGVQVVRDGAGNEYLGTYPFATGNTAYFGALPGAPLRFNPSEQLGDAWTVVQYLADGYGDIWAIGRNGGSTSTVYFYRLINWSGRAVGDYHSFNVASGSAGSVLAGVHDVSSEQFLIYWNGLRYAIDDTSFAINASDGGAGFSYATHARFINHPPGMGTIWDGTTQVSLASAAALRSVTAGNWVGGTGETIYDPINHALIAAGPGDAISWLYLDRVGDNGVTLRSIVEGVSEVCGIDLDDLDATDLDQTVRGYSWTQGSGKDILSPLFDIYDSDIRPHGFGIEAKKRDGTSAGTIDVTEFVRSGESPRYSITIAQDTDLPRRLSVTFADVNADQQPNNVTVQRPLVSIDGARELSVDMTTWAADADEARQLAERYFRRIWNGRETYAFGLTPKRLALEPADVWGLTFDGISRVARLEKMTLSASGEIRTEWTRDYPGLAVTTTTAGAAMDGRAEETIYVAGLAQGFVLDIPLVRDGDNGTNPILYYAAGPYGGSFSGATIIQKDGAEYTLEIAGVPSTHGVTWGMATDELPDALSSVWDRSSSLNVTLKNGEITSVTEAECDASPTLNLFAFGKPGRWEIIQAADATLELDGTTTLSTFKRGRRGTEWATGLHEVGDYLVSLTSLPHVEMGLSDLNTALSFKAVAYGREPESAYPINIDPFTAAALKPLSPVHVEATKDSGTGDWTINWVRRARVGGAWVAGTTVPVGEVSEAYEVVIGDRVIETTSASATYTAAMQTEDGGSVAIGDLDLAIYQMSDAVGRGFGTSASF